MARKKKPPTPKQKVAAVRNLIKARLRLRYGGRSQSISADRERFRETVLGKRRKRRRR